LDHLDKLESRSIHILREAYSEFNNICMLWSVGKDSTAMLWLARKAFFGHVPIPLVHIDTSYMIPEMIEHRDKLAKKWNGATHLECCGRLKTAALKNTLNGNWRRYRYNHNKDEYELDSNREPYTGVIVGARADEEGSRSKERYFSPRDRNNDWDIGDQPPEFWDQYKTDFAPGTHVRIHPLLDWTELDVWEYIQREKIPMVSLYFDQGQGKRYRSLGCAPCTEPVESTASTVDEVVEELKTGKFANIAEREGRAQDKEDGGGLEELRKDGYM
jgi:sulfate adenylyltransferase subunit 2